MTKNQEFQKELNEKIIAGVKPSTIKKLKKSKSADDISTSSTSNIPLKKSQSQLELPISQQPSLGEQITQLKEQVKFHAETAANYLQSLQTSQAKVSELEKKVKDNPPNVLLQDQLKEKQKEVENLREKLEKKEDQILELRLESIRDFGKYFEKLKQIRQELEETVEEASSEINSSDDKVSSLRTKLFTASQQINSLQKDLNLAQRLIELRKDYEPNQENN